ncbi:YceI family protein [Melioribacter roseus P3M-2]|uniref:YceI family protein n=1 Tax=Melioribacter roseus (strain DSM 23840 / JCM 17771 / VKM B-2668 / P3M-2) TaxID=1191523 RepID=I6ZR98_MELRP|nr:YceI family protein [Melioribacter roseus]AFN74589.1 YceI family protein [Melioribacter roseus P3M-2]
MRKLFLSSLILFLAVGLINAQTKWNFDKSHSKIAFKVKHMVISEVTGYFNEYEGAVETNGDNFENAKINFTIDVNSIDTDNEKRDEHLKSDDFFNAAKFPKITFVGKSLKKVADNKYKLVGDLTIRDNTKEVTLDVTYNGMVKDPWGNTRAGFKVTGTINRFDFGLKWNALLELGGAVVSEDVDIVIDVQLIKAK